ncbi:MAG TPA: glycosyltransferase, partial [Ktedonobacteraceae bacterium]|nr:glycosyltransferase [Ktedonobacteraceae bacterium]
PSILVPLPPNIGSSPQEVNAAMFDRERAAIVIKNDDLMPEVLVEQALAAITSPTRLGEMARSANAFAKPSATQEIASELAGIAKAGK